MSLWKPLVFCIYICFPLGKYLTAPQRPPAWNLHQALVKCHVWPGNRNLSSKNWKYDGDIPGKIYNIINIYSIIYIYWFFPNNSYDWDYLQYIYTTNIWYLGLSENGGIPSNCHFNWENEDTKIKVWDSDFQTNQYVQNKSTKMNISPT